MHSKYEIKKNIPLKDIFTIKCCAKLSTSKLYNWKMLILKIEGFVQAVQRQVLIVWWWEGAVLWCKIRVYPSNELKLK